MNTPSTLPELAHLDPSSVDRRTLRAETAALVVELRAIKALLRQTWTAPMAAVQRRFLALRRAATIACVLQAGLRGRRHLPAADPSIWEEAARLAARHRRAPPLEVRHELG